jgi:hypothetical protein
VEPRLIFVEENIQGEPTTTFVLNVQVVCMCVLSYGIMSAGLSIKFLEQVLVRFVFGQRSVDERSHFRQA